MNNKLAAYLQYVYPQHLLTSFAGKLAATKHTGFKNYLINQFIQAYDVNMSEALIEDPHSYATFNDFFTRQLKPGIRPIAPDPYLISPADGEVSQFGNIENSTLMQAKGYLYDLKSLLANDPDSYEKFRNGRFATIYLAPRDYHRVHMPIDGTLIKSMYVPGQLFSVNKNTSQTIPQLFTRNERVISVFDTAIGPIAIIMVGAIIVGNIKMVWQTSATRAKHIRTETVNISLKKGDELGLFQLGSTVIVLFPPQTIEWQPLLHIDKKILLGEPIAFFSSI